MKNIYFLSFLILVLYGCTDSNQPTDSSNIEIKEFSLGKGKENIIDRNTDWSMHYTNGERNGKSFYIVNGKEEKSYDIVYNFIFSPNGKRYAYIGAQVNGDSVRNFFIVDGKEVKSYLVPNYISMIGDRKALPRTYHMETILFSPDSKRVAFSARRGDKSFIVLDGIERREYDQIDSKVFSPDSKRFAYSVKSGSQWLVLIDGKEEKKYGDVKSLTFSPDSRKFAYIAYDRKIFGYQENSSNFITVTKASSDGVSHSGLIWGHLTN